MTMAMKLKLSGVFLGGRNVNLGSMCRLASLQHESFRIWFVSLKLGFMNLFASWDIINQKRQLFSTPALSYFEIVHFDYLDAELYVKKVFTDRQKNEVFVVEMSQSLGLSWSCRRREFTSLYSHRAVPRGLMSSSCLGWHWAHVYKPILKPMHIHTIKNTHNQK